MRNLAISISEATDILKVHNKRHRIRKSNFSLTTTYRRSKINQARGIVKEWKKQGVAADILENLKEINPILVIKLELQAINHAENDVNTEEGSPQVNTLNCTSMMYMPVISLGNYSDNNVSSRSGHIHQCGANIPKYERNAV